MGIDVNHVGFGIAQVYPLRVYRHIPELAAGKGLVLHYLALQVYLLETAFVGIAQTPPRPIHDPREKVQCRRWCVRY